MESVEPIVQDPAPGTRRLRYQGDVFTVSLAFSSPAPGQAFVRTNIGRAAITRGEIVAQVHEDRAPLGRDWFDIPMVPDGPGRFVLRLPLCQVGHFEAKAYFLPEGSNRPLWPAGGNTAVNVCAAGTCGANIVYNAFVRQFGPNKAGSEGLSAEEAGAIRGLDGRGYTVIPPSGTFRQFTGALDFILGDLGCRFVLLLPIHPTPTTYARMGRFGSPYAALSFTAVDPALAEFDTAATPLEQFLELVDAVHARRGGVLIDIAINHTGWAASLHESHPQWLVRDHRGRIEMPGAWGVTWADLTRLDYSRKDLWRHMAEVFLTWCRRGVDGFRCDAGYMIPVPAWQYIIARVREQFPHTVFFLEGLGGKISVTRDLLNRAGFDWAYSELFQNYDRGAIEHYLPEADGISRGEGLAVHFAETHDNDRLAARSAVWAKMRTALCALFSHQGAFAFANGVEWLATEKIDVHGAPSLNWGAPENQVADIQRLNALLRTHPAFFPDTEQRLVQTGVGNHLVLLRRHRPDDRTLLVVVNLDEHRPVQARWPADAMGNTELFDLLGDEPVTAGPESGDRLGIDLAPGQVRCLTARIEDAADLAHALASPAGLPRRVLDQRFRAKALAVWSHFYGTADLGDFDAAAAAEALAADPAEFCRKTAPAKAPPMVATWRWPTDLRREVMVPPGHFLLVKADAPFRARLAENGVTRRVEESLDGGRSGHFALFTPLTNGARTLALYLSVGGPGNRRRASARIRQLPPAAGIQIQGVFGRREFGDGRMLYLGTNGRGGMLRAAAAWGRLFSRYDALLAANFSDRWPEDRWVMLTRMRAWLVYQEYSQELGFDCQTDFLWSPGGPGRWVFSIPTGQGEHVRLTLTLSMTPDENRTVLTAFRHRAGAVADRLDDHSPVTLILRPDLESRSFHDTTKAYTGPESAWPRAVRPQAAGFVFAPDSEKPLTLSADRGRFVVEPEWQYMVHRPVEVERGLDPDSDLFSPGYFSLTLAGGETAEMVAMAGKSGPPRTEDGGTRPRPGWDPATVLTRALDQYRVRRGRHATVIAGYPWFLDWGRDSLIAARGLIAAGMTAAARDVILQFAAFSREGTVPNMIRGDDTGNRDTSDAPLWLFTACNDYMAATGSNAILEADCGGRTLGRALIDLGRGLTAGAPNQVAMDSESGLIFSPAHFTWMDTNHPAGTPRQGYPVEIQALWHAALTLLAGIDTEPAAAMWQNRAQQVSEALKELFFLSDAGYLADCLLADPGTPAARAVADDALRPNQLFALTLGAVTDPACGRRILSACEALLVPGGLRSLADRAVAQPLVIEHQGQVLGDPLAPYRGNYVGDEDTQRKPAYHNGTAWTWLLPTYCEAWAVVYGPEAHDTARSWLTSAVDLARRGCVGHLPEILDGDAPHHPRGCDAQAWGVSELLRVWKKLAPLEDF